jgi:Flp pilus assembly pilin Flp
MSKFYTLIILSLLPLLTFAVGADYTPPTTPETVNDIFFSFAWGNMKGFIPALIAIALVTFLTGVVKYIKGGDNEESRESGRTMMVYGIIVLFVMVAFWGIVQIVVGTFFSGDVSIPNYLPIRKQ